MPAIARIGDPISCGDTVAGGSGSVFINGLPASRSSDLTAGHVCGPPTQFEDSPYNVFANNQRLVVVGSSIVPHGTCGGPPHNGIVMVGSATVFVGT